MIDVCIKSGCNNPAHNGSKFCQFCLVCIPNHERVNMVAETSNDAQKRREADTPMSVKYPKYYKPVPQGAKELDVYAVCQMFPVQDDTGCINHARKKLLVPGTRTGGKSMYNDIKEARDTLNRWLELNPSIDETAQLEKERQAAKDMIAHWDSIRAANLTSK